MYKKTVMQLNELYKKSDKYRVYIFIVIGVMLMSWATCAFFKPFRLNLGGATGVAIILNGLFNIPLWLTNLVINIPLFFLGGKVFNKYFLLRSLSATLLLSVCLRLFEGVEPVEGDYFTAVVFGGIIYGVGIGLVLATESTTGGSDMLAGIIAGLGAPFPMSRIMVAIDAVIIAAGMGIIGAKTTMYGIVAVVIGAKGIDLILEGADFAKVAIIITSKGEFLGERLMADIKRGVTLLPAKGLYSGESKDLLIVALGKRQVPALKALINALDPSAFVLFADIREVMGAFDRRNY